VSLALQVWMLYGHLSMPLIVLDFPWCKEKINLYCTWGSTCSRINDSSKIPGVQTKWEFGWIKMMRGTLSHKKNDWKHSNSSSLVYGLGGMWIKFDSILRLIPSLSVNHNAWSQNKSRYIKFHKNVFLTLLIKLIFGNTAEICCVFLKRGGKCRINSYARA